MGKLILIDEYTKEALAILAPDNWAATT